MSNGDKSGFAWYIKAATPAAPGVAMEVPDMPVYWSPVLKATDMTLLPTYATFGFTRSSSVGPWLEYTAMAEFLSSAPTVIASSAEPGVPI